jgi:hypothetical protein
MTVETLSWEVLSEHIARGVPFALPLGGTRNARILFDPTAGQLAMMLPAGKGSTTPASPLREVRVEMQIAGGETAFRASVESASLHPAFHQLAVLTTRLFEQHDMSASEAFGRAIESWRELLYEVPLLSDEAQLGLRGELSVLTRLLYRMGPDATDCWTAYNRLVPGRHDFRLPSVELEVKTTRRRRRVHHFNGLEQLRASPGQTLKVVSLMFEQAGGAGGWSLCDAVGHVRTLLPSGTPARLLFETRLTSAKYRDDDAVFYAEKLIASEPARVIDVDDSFPVIDRDSLLGSMSPGLLTRVLSVSYEADLTGLGYGPSSEKYIQLFGDAPLD